MVTLISRSKERDTAAATLTLMSSAQNAGVLEYFTGSGAPSKVPAARAFMVCVPGYEFKADPADGAVAREEGVRVGGTWDQVASRVRSGNGACGAGDHDGSHWQMTYSSKRLGQGLHTSGSC